MGRAHRLPGSRTLITVPVLHGAMRHATYQTGWNDPLWFQRECCADATLKFMSLLRIPEQRNIQIGACRSAGCPPRPQKAAKSHIFLSRVERSPATIKKPRYFPGGKRVRAFPGPFELLSPSLNDFKEKPRKSRRWKRALVIFGLFVSR